MESKIGLFKYVYVSLRRCFQLREKQGSDIRAYLSVGLIELSPHEIKHAVSNRLIASEISVVPFKLTRGFDSPLLTSAC